MHPAFGFSPVQILWILTFAALLVLLVVLLGRDRAKRFPVFTAGIVLVAFRLLSTRLLYGRLSPVATNVFFISLAMLSGLLSIAVVVELSRRAFAAANRKAWLIGAPITLLISGLMIALWGPWPGWNAFTGGGLMVALRIMQLVAQRSEMFADGLAIELGLLVLLYGRRFQAGWLSHTQQVVIGLSTAAIGQLTVRGVWQAIATHAVPHSEEEYLRLLSLQDKLYNSNSAIYVAVLIWWIAFLWREEPGAAASTQPVEISLAEPPQILPPQAGEQQTDSAAEAQH